jgi:Fur family transcriptional regulator, ferric uptake regulator
MEHGMDEKPALLMTEQRRVILEELGKLKSHPTADEIYERVRERLPSISLGTVYRNLETLSSAGIIQKLELAGSQKRFDGMVENHYHVRCVKCGRVDDAHVAPMICIEESAKGIRGYRIVSHRLEFEGICLACQGDLTEPFTDS